MGVFVSVMPWQQQSVRGIVYNHHNQPLSILKAQDQAYKEMLCCYLTPFSWLSKDEADRQH